MASEQPVLPRVKDDTQRRSGSRTQPAQHSGPPLLNNGPELLRDSNC